MGRGRALQHSDANPAEGELRKEAPGGMGVLASPCVYLWQCLLYRSALALGLTEQHGAAVRRLGWSGKL